LIQDLLADIIQVLRTIIFMPCQIFVYLSCGFIEPAIGIRIKIIRTSPYGVIFQLLIRVIKVLLHQLGLAQIASHKERRNQQVFLLRYCFLTPYCLILQKN